MPARKNLAELEALTLSMLAERTGSICPSEVARRHATNWRPLMVDVRAAAARLAKKAKVIVTQKRTVVDPLTVRGPIRISLPPAENNVPLTPDKRYIVVRERLWRSANPHLSAAKRKALVSELMAARRAVKETQRAKDAAGLRRARAAVEAAKRSLGERGPVWWTDGTPDYNRRLIKNTPYVAWWQQRARPARQ